VILFLDDNIVFLFLYLHSCICINIGMKIELIGEDYPEADIIASADIRMGYINR